MTSTEFRILLEQLASGWRSRDYAGVAAHFATDVEYGDPQRYTLTGRDALRAFFAADDGREQQIAWHLMLFDEAQQVGAAEYTYEGTHRYHGVALARVGQWPHHALARVPARGAIQLGGLRGGDGVSGAGVAAAATGSQSDRTHGNSTRGVKPKDTSPP